MPKLQRPEALHERKDRIRKRYQSALIQRGVKPSKARELADDHIRQAFPRARFDDRHARRVLESLPTRGNDRDEKIRQAFLQVPPSRGRVLPSAATVAAETRLPEKTVSQWLRVVMMFAGLRPISERPRFWRKEKARLRALGVNVGRLRTYNGWLPNGSSGQRVFHARIDEAVAAGEEMDAAMARIYESTDRCCAGCGIPLLAARFHGDKAGLRLQPNTVSCPGSPSCRKAASRKA